jgi:hypothetical protein
VSRVVLVTLLLAIAILIAAQHRPQPDVPLVTAGVPQGRFEAPLATNCLKPPIQPKPQREA